MPVANGGGCGSGRSARPSPRARRRSTKARAFLPATAIFRRTESSIQAAHRGAPGHPHRQGLPARLLDKGSWGDATRHWTAGSMREPPQPSAASIGGPRTAGASSNGISGGRNVRHRPGPSHRPNRGRHRHPARARADSPTAVSTGSVAAGTGRGGGAKQENSAVLAQLAVHLLFVLDHRERAQAENVIGGSIFGAMSGQPTTLNLQPPRPPQPSCDITARASSAAPSGYSRQAHDAAERSSAPSVSCRSAASARCMWIGVEEGPR
jgi:hypothetical protein